MSGVAATAGEVNRARHRAMAETMRVQMLETARILKSELFGEVGRGREGRAANRPSWSLCLRGSSRFGSFPSSIDLAALKSTHIFSSYLPLYQ